MGGDTSLSDIDIRYHIYIVVQTKVLVLTTLEPQKFRAEVPDTSPQHSDCREGTGNISGSIRSHPIASFTFSFSAMSADMVRNFFPSVVHLYQTQPLFHKLWSFAFPAEVEELCPRPHMAFQVSRDLSLTIHWPLGSIFCVAGIVMGLLYSFPLLSDAYRSRNPKTGSFTWGLAFMWYGLMSLGGLMFHCILTTSHFFYLLDVVSTASCCMAIISGIGIGIAWRMNPHAPPPDDTRLVWRACMYSVFVLVIGLSVLGAQYIRDLLYVLPSLIAVGFGFHFYLKVMFTRPGPSIRMLVWLHCSVLAALLSLGAVIFDSWLCKTFGAEFSCLPWFFLGADIALPCLYHSIKQLQPHAKSS